MTATQQSHSIRWFGRVEPSEEYPDGYVPRTSAMRGRDWGWDVRCSCGWESRTGGAIEASVKRSIADHLWDAGPDGEFARQTKLAAERHDRYQERTAARMRSWFGSDWTPAEPVR